MKQIKCSKCGIRFKDREDEQDKGVFKNLCFNCRFIWKCLGFTIQALGSRSNRTIALCLDNVSIVKTKKI